MSLLRLFPILFCAAAFSACDDSTYHVTITRGDRVQVNVDRESSTADVALPKSIETQINLYTSKHYRKCWIEASLPAERIPYMPIVEFRLARDGSLDGPPKLLNPEIDPGKRILGEQALQAVKRCSPIPMPQAFAEHYDYWQTVDLYFRGELPIESRRRQ